MKMERGDLLLTYAIFACEYYSVDWESVFGILIDIHRPIYCMVLIISYWSPVGPSSCHLLWVVFGWHWHDGEQGWKEER